MKSLKIPKYGYSAPRYPGDAHLQNFVDLLRHKYSQPKMDVVIGVDDEATDILLKYGDELFPGIPIVFLSAERKRMVPPKFWGSSAARCAPACRGWAFVNHRRVQAFKGSGLFDLGIWPALVRLPG